MTLAPQYLKKGDKVMLLSTARKMSVEDIQPAKAIIESWGLQVELGETIGASCHQYAGDDALRLKDFQRAIDNDSVRAVFCARGGYGTVRFIDQIDFSKFLRSPKWIIGFSDVTYLHTLINHQLGIQTLHASMPSLFTRTADEAIQNIGKVLLGEEIMYAIPPHALNRGSVMTGETIGGNLSILYSITGTKSGFDTNGKILFIEDLDEQLYHIDRMMINLKRSGKLDHLAGLLVGGLSAMHDNEVPFGKTAEEIIFEHVADKNYPVCFNFPAGHIRENYPLILGKKQHSKFHMSFKVIFLGPESTGKTSISREIAILRHAIYVPEFARTYIEECGANYTYADILNIAKTQADMELAAMHSGKLVICDTDLISIKIWLEFYDWNVPDWIENFIMQYKADKYVLFYPDIPWIADEQRKNPNDRQALFSAFEQELGRIKANYSVVRGEGLIRVNAAIEAIKDVGYN